MKINMFDCKIVASIKLLLLSEFPFDFEFG